MPALPTVGGSNNTWGTELNAFLGVSLAADGTLKNGVSFGTNPASAGAIRLPNATWIAARNAANSADVNLLQVDSSNRIIYGTRMESNSYLAEANTSGLHGILAAFATRYGSGTVSDRTMGIYTVVNDQVTVARRAITGVANNGSGLYRVTAVTHGFVTGDRVMIYGAGGVTTANNAWTITRIDANNFDLQGSTFAGAYTSGGFASTAGQLYGGQFTVTPIVTRDFGVSGGSAAFGDDVLGCAVYNNGTAKGTAAFNGGSVGGSGWLYGLIMDGAVDTGITWSGAITNYGIDFHLAASFGLAMIRYKNNVWTVGRNTAGSGNVNVFKINTSDKIEMGSGMTMPITSTYGFDMLGGTFAGGAIRLPNNNFIVGRNNAGSADVSLLGLDTTDSANFGAPIRAGAGLIVSNTFNIQFSTGTGSKIGTTSSEKLGFWGATPIARPSAYTQTFATADKTHAARTSASTATTASTTTTPFGYTTQAQADAIVTNLNAVRADLDDTAQVVNALIDDLQAIGLVG